MRQEDLLELFRSIVEEDAIIARLYRHFHLEKHYALKELDTIIQRGVTLGELQITHTSDANQLFTNIDWALDNSYQEILATNQDQYVKLIFGKVPALPEFAKIFVDANNA
ncbi:MAG: hypothetical protein Q4A10_01510 [Aerococcaceae bacterium]|nr:hypothetical protein [Aerococcaceae bacterium]